MASRWLADLIGTKKNTFSVLRALLSAAGLTAARTFTLPDESMTLAGRDVAQAFTATQTIQKNAVGVTATDGLVLENTTAATSGSGNQQWSPRVRLSGRGWDGAASQTINFQFEVQPTSGGGANLVFSTDTGGIATSSKVKMSANGFLGVGRFLATPLAPLHFSETIGGITTEGLRLENTSGSGFSGVYMTFYVGSGEKARITAQSNSLFFSISSNLVATIGSDLSFTVEGDIKTRNVNVTAAAALSLFGGCT